MSLNSLSAAFGLGNIVSSALGGPTLRLWKDKGYYPSEWGHTGGSIEAMAKQKVNIGGFFVDAIFMTTTEHSLTVTQHPVQTGANLSDHAFVNPIRIAMEIGISDVMAYRIAGCYEVPGETKSISAYRTLCKLQAERKPLKVLTKLNTYENMLIENIQVNDDPSTAYALKASIELVQILVAQVTEEKVSAREWTSAQQANPNEVSPQEDQGSLLGQINGDAGYWNPERGGVG